MTLTAPHAAPRDLADVGLRVDSVDLGPGVGAWFTGRVSAARPEDAPGAPGNLSHHRPHRPQRLARTRQALLTTIDLDANDLVVMRQVHGSRVATVTAATPAGAELRGVDALVTAEPGRALAVQVADCVPLLLASDAGPVAAVHAGRRGVRNGVIQAALAALEELGAGAATLRAAIGPAIGGCCYEVPATMRDDLAERLPAAAATTTWGTPALDLPAGVAELLRQAGVHRIVGPPGCTHCDEQGRWFSHRADPSTGRQLGIVVRRREPT